MSYVYGMRGTCKETPLTAAIRGELYPHSYSSIDWNAARNRCAKEDLYYPHPKVVYPLPCITYALSQLGQLHSDENDGMTVGARLATANE